METVSMVAEYNENIYTDNIIDEAKKASFIEKISNNQLHPTITLLSVEVGCIILEATFKGNRMEDIDKWRTQSGASRFLSSDEYRFNRLIKDIIKPTREIIEFSIDGLSVNEKLIRGRTIDQAINLLKRANNRFKCALLDLPGPAMSCVMGFLSCKDQSSLLRTVKIVSQSLNVDTCSELQKLGKKYKLEKEYVNALERFNFPKIYKFVEMDINLNLTRKDGEDIFSIALMFNKSDLLVKIIDSKYNLNHKYRNNHKTTPLMEAIRSRELWSKMTEKDLLYLVQILLDKGANPNLTGINSQTPLKVAIYSADNTELIQLLLKYGAIIRPIDILVCMQYKRSLEMVELLLRNIESGKNLILCEMAYHNWIKYLPLILEKDVDVNYRNKQMETPLIIAGKRRHIHFVNALLKAGADPMLVDATGTTALEYLVQ